MILFLAVSLFFTVITKAQLAPEDLEKIKNELSEAGLEKYNKAEEDINAADAMYQEILKEDRNNRKLFSKYKNKKKKAEKLVVGTKMRMVELFFQYEKAYNIKTNVLKDKLDGCTVDDSNDEIVVANMKEEAKRDNHKAVEKYKIYKPFRKKKGKYRKGKLKRKVEYEKLKQDLKSAREFRRNAIDRQFEALCVALVCKPKLEEVPDVKVDTTTVEDSSNVVIEETQETNEKSMNGIVYKVQIYAASKKLTPEEIEQEYAGELEVEELEDDGLFKYIIGHYETYETAKQAKDYCGVVEAFVIAFEDGIKIPVSEAKEKENN